MKNARLTPQIKAITEIMAHCGHATNAELLQTLRKTYPTISATTVHRITNRLQQRGQLSHAPSDAQGSMRYDSHLPPHDHFICDSCGGIRDIDVAESLIPTISKALGGCKITGRLVIRGNCEKCSKEKGV